MKHIHSYIELVRPYQWVKQVFIFLPMFFWGSLLNLMSWISCAFAFLSFSFLSSSIYCFNDIIDSDSDKKHPQKKIRPIASGKISRVGGWIAMLTCMLLAAIVILIAIKLKVFVQAELLIAFYLAYFVINILYSVKLKLIAILDVFIVSLGFVIRVLVGGASTGIPISHWIVLLTFLLSLFLALSKRRDDVLLYETTGEKVRNNVSRYSIPFLNLSISIIASIVIVCYIMYTVSDEVILRVGSPYLYVTSVFVIAGIIRYLQLTIVDSKSGSPTKILLKDRFIQSCILCWVILFILILYA